MKLIIIVLIFCLNASLSISQPFSYKQSELMQTKELSDIIKAGKGKQVHILNIGVERRIKNSIEIGIVSSPSKFKILQSTLSKYNKSDLIVIYCGCCKLENCPNVAQAAEKIKGMGFKNLKILNMVDGINEDWIDKGYQMEY